MLSWVQMVCASHIHKGGAGGGAYVPGSGGPQPGSRRQPMGPGDPLSGSGAYIPGSHSTSASGTQCLGGSLIQSVSCCSRHQTCTACPTTVRAGLQHFWGKPCLLPPARIDGQLMDRQLAGVLSANATWPAQHCREETKGCMGLSVCHIAACWPFCENIVLHVNNGMPQPL